MVKLTPCPPPPPRVEWPALTSVTHRDDAVDGGPWIHLNNRPLLSLLLAKFASSTSPQKPPATYTRVNDFGPHTDSIFRGRLIRECDLYASIYGKHQTLSRCRKIWQVSLFIVVTDSPCEIM